MASDRLICDLVLMHIHKDVEISTAQFMKDFDRSGHRRIDLAFERDTA